MFLKHRSLIKELIEVPGHGAVLKVVPGEADARLQSDSIHEVLFRFMEQRKPYVGLVIDLRGTKYAVSAADLATLTYAMMDHERQCLIPCSFLLDDAAAKLFQSMLDLTQSGFAELKIVDSMERAIRHIAEPAIAEGDGRPRDPSS